MGMTDGAPVLDPAVLDELRDSLAGDEECIADLVATYVNEGSGHLNEMQTAAAAGDAAGIVRPAHTLKSSSAALGAMRLSQIAREIEFAGREGDASGLLERVAAASSAWDETMAAMAAAGLTR